MTTLVTGANGFVGAAVCRALCEQHEEVRAFVRHGANTSNLASLPVTFAYGDLRDKDSIARAMEGCQFLYHVAADYRLWVPDPRTMYEINVEGSRNIVNAAVAAGVDRIVYTSSVAVINPDAHGGVSDETTPTLESDMIGHYKRSKFLAEKAVRQLIDEVLAPVVIVSPSTPIGPGDIRPTPTGRIVLDALRGRMPAYVNTGLNLAHVDDVARGHIAACRHGNIGRSYILGGENISLKSFLGLIAKSGGHRPPLTAIPHSVAWLYAGLDEIWSGISKKEPAATRDAVRMSKKCMYFSSERARSELNYQARPAEESVDAAVNWFKYQLQRQKNF